MTQLIRTMLQNHAVYQVQHWRDLGIVHGFGVRDVDVATYTAHRAQRRIATTKQMHSNIVHRLDAQNPRILYGDAFIARSAGTVCCVRTADCVPILLFDPARRAVAAIHAGWQGLAANIIEATIGALQKNYGTRGATLEAAIGPAIALRHYEVGEKVCAALTQAGYDIAPHRSATRKKQGRIDLRGIARAALLRCDVCAEKIFMSEHSTFDRPGEFHSYRRGTSPGQRQVSFIVCPYVLMSLR